jgi:hypothetical protein
VSRPRKPQPPALEKKLEAFVLEAAEQGEWQAARWLLERKWPERWAYRGVKQPPEPAVSSSRLDELAKQRARRRGEAR